MENFIPYGKQFIDEDDIKAVVEVLKSDFITQGPKIKEFEEALASYVGAKYAVVFNSGTSALHGAYFALDLKKDDEFITTPMTFVATSNAGLYLGAKPVFVDIEKDTGNIDISKIEEKITDKTKLLSVVHYSGHPVDMEKVKELADKYNLKIVEDACHALGAKYKNERIGNCKYSDVTIFSFHPVKHITTGEGGAVLTNNKEIYEKLLIFRNHGITKDRFINNPDGDWYYEMQYLGYNYRMTDIQASLGISQLKKLNRFIEKRRNIAKIYNKAFKDNPYFDLPVEKDYAYHSYHLYPIKLKDKYKEKKAEIFRSLRKEGVGVQVHYIPVYLQPYYQNLGYKKGLCPIAEDFYKREISLPIFPAMTEKDIEYVIEKVFKVFI
ncbi:UDP-4-amino-4,6-dideoxy-N-acetyl-beta-L-altrosamine transaminase [Hydrogenothermus marinus]|uniref:UDP-4-amino-4, 6-dideoxy-N-acetyl-beta-L-altrosamine transaminase n=1 Tax=Hydrogenothermus marinus TaxID=133270 RepID=A0A3M0B7Z2_9AQUI|nr:UDP-4-amino-4,6-dideoxy-N-acetyl-beta-L-altrosamine transaminase [Hydrogenothermus marinus]RMA93271.1 UDP-4-amino-4,6-dideoxy-N-acetyl-beta-L-altrosamine transaminase [Hydrogenothermus marinus]